MRWNSSITLVSHSNEYQDDMGVYHEGEYVEREVFCNQNMIGINTWTHAREARYRADAAVQIRTLDYQGEEEAIYKGVEYSIERHQEIGETTLLQLGRLKSSD